MDDLLQIKENSISYFTLKLGNELFASHVMYVVNIVEVPKITKVPKTPEYIKGVINLHGEVLPVIDIHLKFGMEPAQFTSNTCVLVLQEQLEKEVVE